MSKLLCYPRSLARPILDGVSVTAFPPLLCTFLLAMFFLTIDRNLAISRDWGFVAVRGSVSESRFFLAVNSFRSKAPVFEGYQPLSPLRFPFALHPFVVELDLSFGANLSLKVHDFQEKKTSFYSFEGRIILVGCISNVNFSIRCLFSSGYSPSFNGISSDWNELPKEIKIIFVLGKRTPF